MVNPLIIIPSSSLITVQNVVTISHIVRAHVGTKNVGDAGSPTLILGHG